MSIYWNVFRFKDDKIPTEYPLGKAVQIYAKQILWFFAVAFCNLFLLILSIWLPYIILVSFVCVILNVIVVFMFLRMQRDGFPTLISRIEDFIYRTLGYKTLCYLIDMQAKTEVADTSERDPFDDDYHKKHSPVLYVRTWMFILILIMIGAVFGVSLASFLFWFVPVITDDFWGVFIISILILSFLVLFIFIVMQIKARFGNGQNNFDRFRW